jgi:hypothetical protein
MATQVRPRPSQTDGRQMPATKRDEGPKPKRIPQDPIPVPQQAVRPAAKYPAGYFFG